MAFFCPALSPSLGSPQLQNLAKRIHYGVEGPHEEECTENQEDKKSVDIKNGKRRSLPFSNFILLPSNAKNTHTTSEPSQHIPNSLTAHPFLPW